MAPTLSTTGLISSRDKRTKLLSPKPSASPTSEPNIAPASASGAASTSASSAASDTEIINNAFQANKDRFCKLPTPKEYQNFYLNPSYFEYLESKFQNANLFQFVESKVRFDWDANTSEPVSYPTPSTIHGFFTAKVTNLLSTELDRIAQEHRALKPFRDKIENCGASDIVIRDNALNIISHKSPNGHFRYISDLNEANSVFLLEIGNSKTTNHLSDKVLGYIAELPYCTILTFNFSYYPLATRSKINGVSSGSLSLYTSTEPGVADRLATDKAFRKAGQAVKGSIEIPFTFFIPPDERNSLPAVANTASLRINFADLDQLLTQAQGFQRSSDTRSPCKRPRPDLVQLRNKDGTIEEFVKRDPKRQKTGLRFQLSSKRRI